MCISTFVVAWNCLAAGYKDLSGFSHPAVVPWLPVLSIPMTAFSLTSTSVGLLLGEFILFEGSTTAILVLVTHLIVHAHSLSHQQFLRSLG